MDSSIALLSLASAMMQSVGSRSLHIQDLAQPLATEAPPILVRKLADGEVCFLLVGTWSAERYTPNLHLRTTEARVLRPASHLARSLLRHCIDRENLPPTNTGSPATRRCATGQCPID